MRHANIAMFIPHAGCPHTCSFCNQKTISGHSSQPTADDVRNTVENALSYLGEKAKNAELAFFGGSFTAIDRDYMISLLEAAKPYVESGRICGLRCSTRPDCINEEILDLLKDYGMTSIELGAQSMSDRVLSLNERGHTADDVRRAARLIRARGFELGLQMMTGLYGDDDEGAMYSAREIAALEPDTVRIYPTVVLEGTRLAELYKEGIYKAQGLDEAVALCARLLLFFFKKNIDVIKLGLHAEEGVGRDRVAGAYHPALRELCEGRIYLEKELEAVRRLGVTGRCVIKCARGEVSKATGQKRCNVETLAKMGVSAKVAECDGIGKYEIACEKE